MGYREFYHREPVSKEVLVSFIQERMKNNEVVILLAYLGDKAVGVAQLYWGYSTLSLGKFWALYDLYIDKAHRGQGLGIALLEACKSFAIQDSGFKLELKTEHDNLAAQSLYEKFGFVKDEVYLHYKLALN